MALPIVFLAACARGHGAVTSLFPSCAQQAAAALEAGALVGAEIDNKGARYLCVPAADGGALPAGIAPERVEFEIGSITKVFTGLLLAQTVLDGKARLDDPIAKYLPADLRLAPEVAAITLEQLATHSAGLPRMPDNFAPANPADPFADYTADRLYAFLRRLAPAAPAPQPAAYSNVGVGLLGHLLERIHGKSYAALVVEKIARPLGLDDTTVALSPGQSARFATPHDGAKIVAPWTLSALSGAGALRSTAADLSLLIRNLLANSPHPLRRAWDLARQPRADFGPDRIGLCILMGQREGALWYFHTGGTGGFRSRIEFSPEAHRGYVLLQNNTAPDPDGVLDRLRSAPSAATREEVALAAERLEEFAGVFGAGTQVVFTVLPGPGNRIVIRMIGQGFGPDLFHAGSDRLFSRAVAAEFQFGRDAAGRVDSLSLLQNGRELATRRLDQLLPVGRPLPADAMAEYAGSYSLGPERGLEVLAGAHNLFVRSPGGELSFLLVQEPDRFVFESNGDTLAFERDAAGRVTAAVLGHNGRNSRAPRAAP